MSSFLSVFKATNTVSISDTLFKESNINTVSMDMYTRGYVSRGEELQYWRGSIQFKDGDTTGKKEFKVEGKEGMIKLVQQMENFIKTL